MGEIRVDAPMQGTIVTVDVSPGQSVRAGQQLMLIESMKMHHAIESPDEGTVTAVLVIAGATVTPGTALVVVTPGAVVHEEGARAATADPSAIRPDLEEVRARHAIGLDAARPQAVERRRAVGRRTARENVADLVDEGSFVEYGPLVIAAQRRRRSVDELIERTPADGMIGGIGTVNGHLFDGHAAQVIAVSYDYTVLAGTQGLQNHRKKDRLFDAGRVDAIFPSCSSPRVEAGGPATPTPRVSACSTAGPSSSSPS